MTVTLAIPTMLAQLTGSKRVAVDADTVGGALAALIKRHPELHVHVFDESGALRTHLRLFHNDDAASSMSDSVADGDTVTILQAVSGGAVPTG